MKMKTCDICKQEDLMIYIDGKTQFGPWANMCLDCFYENGVGLGLGKGQCYQWDSEKQKYIKIGG
jgi:hypothetical protein